MLNKLLRLFHMGPRENREYERGQRAARNLLMTKPGPAKLEQQRHAVAYVGGRFAVGWFAEMKASGHLMTSDVEATT